ncbi:hypothetical protein U1Q18_042354 [Sarracenia purpurea var. burkii]
MASKKLKFGDNGRRTGMIVKNILGMSFNGAIERRLEASLSWRFAKAFFSDELLFLPSRTSQGLGLNGHETKTAMARVKSPSDSSIFGFDLEIVKLALRC